MCDTKRILILSESFGMGHTKAAESIKEGLKIYNSNYKIEVIELGAFLKPSFNLLLTEMYLKIIRYSPKIWGVIYNKVKHNSLNSRFEYILYKIIYTQTLNILESFKPDLIITTHPFPTAIIARINRLNNLRIPIHTVLTDYGVHGAWINNGVDYYYVPSTDSKEQLIQLGVMSNKIYVTGIPVHPKYWRKYDKRQIRNKLNLKDRLTILFMGGGLGIGIKSNFIEKLIIANPELQVIIVTGHNKNLFNVLKERFVEESNVHIFGFVNNIDELMDASDLLVTKPGGITTSEAILKNLPIILINPLPGQEEENMKYITSNNYGISVSKKEDLLLLINQFSKSPYDFLKNFKIKEQNTVDKTIFELINYNKEENSSIGVKPLVY